MKLIASYRYDCGEGITLIENLYRNHDKGLILGTYYQGPTDKTEEELLKASPVMAQAWAKVRDLELELPT